MGEGGKFPDKKKRIRPYVVRGRNSRKTSKNITEREDKKDEKLQIKYGHKKK